MSSRLPPMTRRSASWCLVLALLVLTRSVSAQQPLDQAWKDIATILQSPPVDAGGYVRFNFPRKDLAVHVGDVAIPASFALTAWVGFDGTPDSATAMGDLVVTAAELGPVLAELTRQSVEVTAVHNHLAGEEPQVTYIHFHLMGPAARTAHALDAALRLTGAPRPVMPAGATAVTIDSGAVFAALGKHGKASGAMAQVGFVLVPGTVTMHGRPVLPALGYASPINVLQVSATRAVATGDFAITERQLPHLLSALAANGVTATAVHYHLVGEEPRLYFVHFWGDAPLADLLRALRAALDATRLP
jgi:Domain of Unknown Function (DUF1259)